MSEIQVGQDAPDFTLENQDKQPVKLSDFKGKKNVVLAFYPLDWSPVCTKENTCFRDDFPKFDAADTVLLGISVDSVWSHKAWRDQLGLKYDLLSDWDRVAVKAYGLHIAEKNLGKRATVVVGKDGKAKYVKVQEITQPRDNNEILEALKSIG